MMKFKEILEKIFNYLDFCNHSWSEWKFSGVFGYKRYQEKKCIKCGKIKQEEVGWDSR